MEENNDVAVQYVQKINRKPRSFTKFRDVDESDITNAFCLVSKKMSPFLQKNAAHFLLFFPARRVER